MKTLLKYLFPLVLALAFLSFAENRGSLASEEPAAASVLNEASCHANISASDSQLCLPRQITYANTQTVQGTARRTNSVNRNNIEFMKSGKILNAGLIYFIQRKSIIIHSSLIEPANKLLYLGQLII